MPRCPTMSVTFANQPACDWQGELKWMAIVPKVNIRSNSKIIKRIKLKKNCNLLIYKELKKNGSCKEIQKVKRIPF